MLRTFQMPLVKAQIGAQYTCALWEKHAQEDPLMLRYYFPIHIHTLKGTATLKKKKHKM